LYNSTLVLYIEGKNRYEETPENKQGGLPEATGSTKDLHDKYKIFIFQVPSNAETRFISTAIS